MLDDEELTRPAAPSPAPAFGGPRPFYAGDLVAGRFRVVREIAEGAMGIVYEAIDEKLGERRALKCAKAGHASRLSPEARTALRVTHPNVCRVFEIHTTTTSIGPIDFLSMEYIDGPTLADELRTRDPLPEPEARAIALQICAGVEAAHAQGLLHRDLKAQNVMLAAGADGARRAVVTDFGLAQETETPTLEQAPSFSGIAGTPAYLAPERWKHGRATVASDIFALGVLLHEIATGRLPGPGPGGGRALSAGVPARWRPIVARCLQANPARRFPSVAEVRAALSGSGRWKRRVAWAAAAFVPVAFITWPILFPAPLAARLAIFPVQSASDDAQTATLAAGASSDLSWRLMQLRPRPPQVVVIPLEETRGLSAADLGQAKDKLGASHVLKATVTRQGDQLLVRGAIIDTTTKLPLAERTGTYAAADPGAVASALSALVASAFRLPRQTTAEHVAPTAYPAYADGVAALVSGEAGYAHAVEAFERAIALDPNSVLPRARLAEACYRGWKATGDERWLARGRDELAGAERLNSDSIAVRLAAGLMSSVPGSYDRAVQEYQRATELDPMNQDAWNGFAQALNLAGHDAEAVAAFDKAIALQPGYYLPINQLGALYYRLGNSGEAEKAWLKVTALAPERFEGHVNLGVLYADLGRYDAAEGELRRALQIEPRSRAVLNNLGALYQYTDRDREAVQYLEQARAVGPQTYTVFLNLGDSYRRLGRQADAADAYRRGRALAEPILLADPRDSATRAFIAYFALRLGDRATAERELGQALSLGKDSGTVLRRAALCFEAIGDRERSLAVLQSAPPVVLKELSRHPDLIELRGDPRFVALLQQSTRG